jgi:hypothetical protein
MSRPRTDDRYQHLKYILVWPNPIFDPPTAPPALRKPDRIKVPDVGTQIFPIDPGRTVQQFPRY